MPRSSRQEYADTLDKAGTKEDFNNLPVGTGPFQFVAYQKDAVIRYKANPDYWGGKQKIDDLVFAITPDAAVRYAEAARPANAMSCPIRTRPTLPPSRPTPNLNLMEQDGPERRLPGLQHQPWRLSTSRKCARR
ncbi:MAG: ABC transporter substrate-binding protein [Agrobacterium sp.]|nr:ABC transporter substrate-binding protein [Agrobacterium sp.]